MLSSPICWKCSVNGEEQFYISRMNCKSCSFPFSICFNFLAQRLPIRGFSFSREIPFSPFQIASLLNVVVATFCSGKICVANLLWVFLLYGSTIWVFLNYFIKGNLEDNNGQQWTTICGATCIFDAVFGK